MLEKYDSVNKCTQEVRESMKLHILGVWQNACVANWCDIDPAQQLGNS